MPSTVGSRRMPLPFDAKIRWRTEHMRSSTGTIQRLVRRVAKAAAIALLISAVPALAQQTAPRDPAEPPQAKPLPKILPRPLGAISRQSIDEKSMRTLI